MPDGSPGRYQIARGVAKPLPASPVASRPKSDETPTSRPPARPMQGSGSGSPADGHPTLILSESQFPVKLGLPSVYPSGHRVLLVEDDMDQAAIVTRWLERSGKSVTLVSSRHAALEQVGSPDYDAVLCDLELPDGSGLDVAKRSKSQWPRRPCIIVTAKGDLGLAVEALRSKVDEFLPKPLTQRKLLSRLDDLLKPVETESILAIGAHPDDVEIGIGGILERHRRAGHQITILTCTGGGSGGTALRRADEAQAAARRLRAVLQMGELPDTAVSDGHETIALIEKAIRDSKATTVYTHSLHDMHQDHRAVHRATLVAARGVPNVFCYQAPSTTTDFNPSHFVDIGDLVEAKMDLIRCHESQAERPYLADDLVRSTARYWGRFAGYVHAEPLEVIRSKG